MRRQVSTDAAAVDDQCGQRRRLVEVEARLPASDRAIAVEPGLVRDERPDDAADPGGTDLEREVPKARGRQGRIAGPCQHELAVPDRPVLSTLTDHVGLVPVARAEDRERREGDGQLFVRRRRERPGAVLRVQGRAGCEVDRDRRRAGGSDVRYAEGARELPLERRRGGRGGRGDGRRHDGEQGQDGCEAAAHGKYHFSQGVVRRQDDGPSKGSKWASRPMYAAAGIPIVELPLPSTL